MAQFDESKHPRKKNGEFAPKRQSDAGQSKKKEPTKMQKLGEAFKQYQNKKMKVGLQFFAMPVDDVDKDLQKFKTFEEKQKRFKALIQSGDINLTIKDGAQRKHFLGTNERKTASKDKYGNPIHLGVMDANPQELVKKHAGNGQILIHHQNKMWLKKERFTNTSNIGIYSEETGTFQSKTRCGLIHYSNDGVHITPAYPIGDEENEKQ